MQLVKKNIYFIYFYIKTKEIKIFHFLDFFTCFTTKKKDSRFLYFHSGKYQNVFSLFTKRIKFFTKTNFKIEFSIKVDKLYPENRTFVVARSETNTFYLKKKVKSPKTIKSNSRFMGKINFSIISINLYN